MEAVMRRLVVALALAFPVCVNAQLMHVEYDAVVSSVDRTVRGGSDFTLDNPRGHPEFTRYSVGDRLHGFLTIDLAAAPADRDPLDPRLGSYPAPARSGGYISGNGPPLVHLVFNDGISVGDERLGSPDELYMIEDQWRLPHGIGQMGILIGTHERDVEIVNGESIVQNIDERPRAGVSLSGYIHKAIRDGARLVALNVGLLFNHVKITPPRTCKA